MPRSHRITWPLPWARMYSAAASHSSMVRRQAALEQHRPVDLAQLAQQGEVLHVARADLQDVGALGHRAHVLGRHHLGDDRHAHRRARRPPAAPGPRTPRPWKASGLVRGGRPRRAGRARPWSRTKRAVPVICSSDSTDAGPGHHHEAARRRSAGCPPAPGCPRPGLARSTSRGGRPGAGAAPAARRASGAGCGAAAAGAAGAPAAPARCATGGGLGLDRAWPWPGSSRAPSGTGPARAARPGPSATARVADVALEVDEEHVLPRPVGVRPRLQLGQRQPVVAQHLQAAQQRALLVAGGEDQAGLAGDARVEARRGRGPAPRSGAGSPRGCRSPAAARSGRGPRRPRASRWPPGWDPGLGHQAQRLGGVHHRHRRGPAAAPRGTASTARAPADATAPARPPRSGTSATPHRQRSTLMVSSPTMCRSFSRSTS